MNELIDKWNSSTFKKPNIYLAVYNGELYIVVDDDKSIITLMSKDKNNIVYAVVKSKSKIIYNPTLGNIYQISDSELDKKLGKPAISVITCPKDITDNSLYRFVSNELTTLLQ